MGEYYVDGQLFHHGVKGMKWGKRRYQNTDSSLTAAGKARYYDGDVKSAKAAVKSASKAYDKSYSNAYRKSAAALSPFKKHRNANDERWQKAMDDAQALNEAKANLKTAKAQRKIEGKLKSAGDSAGRADFYKQKGDEVYKNYDDTAKAFDKSAARLAKEGKHIRADAARKISQAIRDKGSAERLQYKEQADFYLARSNALSKKASDYATKKNVDLGKMRVDAIVKKAKDDAYTNEKEWDIINKQVDKQIENKLNQYRNRG